MARGRTFECSYCLCKFRSLKRQLHYKSMISDAFICVVKFDLVSLLRVAVL